MDLVANALVDRLRAEHAGEINAALIRPRFKWRFAHARKASASPGLGKLRFNADRLLNRFIDYPRRLRRMRDEFDVFHIADHSYAHLVAQVPAGRAIVTCHDLDAFRPLIEPAVTARQRLLRIMAVRQLRGLQNAAMVACGSNATRGKLVRHRLVASECLTTITYGVAPIFCAPSDQRADHEAERMLGAVSADALEILHVGSTIPRKRIDVLLGVFAGIRENCRGARLVRVGGRFTAGQAARARELGVADAVAVLPFVEAAVLAAIYRRAALTLMTSELEGFGLPLIEAMACGTPVAATDLEVLREVGGEAAEFFAVGDVPGGIAAALTLIGERANDPVRCRERRAAGLANAAKYSWSESARRYAELYRQIASTRDAAGWRT
jgi:glycosyltransferase involved in cell wall biosynthesis